VIAARDGVRDWLEQMLWFRGVKPANHDLPERLFSRRREKTTRYIANLDRTRRWKNSNHKKWIQKGESHGQDRHCNHWLGSFNKRSGVRSFIE
jgi:hypothetical protein